MDFFRYFSAFFAKNVVRFLRFLGPLGPLFQDVRQTRYCVEINSSFFLTRLVSGRHAPGSSQDIVELGH